MIVPARQGPMTAAGPWGSGWASRSSASWSPCGTRLTGPPLGGPPGHAGEADRHADLLPQPVGPRDVLTLLLRPDVHLAGRGDPQAQVRLDANARVHPLVVGAAVLPRIHHDLRLAAAV